MNPSIDKTKKDVNDNHPVFEQTEYRRVVRIGDSAFEPPLFVKATDKDGPLQGRAMN